MKPNIDEEHERWIKEQAKPESVGHRFVSTFFNATMAKTAWLEKLSMYEILVISFTSAFLRLTGQGIVWMLIALLPVLTDGGIENVLKW